MIKAFNDNLQSMKMASYLFEDFYNIILSYYYELPTFNFFVMTLPHIFDFDE